MARSFSTIVTNEIGDTQAPDYAQVASSLDTIEIVDEKSMGGIRALSLRAALAGLLCAGMMANSAFADNAATATDEVLAKKIHKTQKHPKAKQRVQTGPVFKGAPDVVAAQIPACSRESAAELNKTYNMKGWVIPFPRFQDSLTQDYGCWRTNLAKLGFGFTAYTLGILQTNTLNHYVPASNLQKYTGQRTTSFEHTNAFLIYDLSQYGVPDGQLVMGGYQAQATYLSYGVNDLTLSQLAYYQTAFNRALEFNIGYIGLDKQFVGSQVGGNIANGLGPSGSIFTLVGGGFDGAAKPAAIVRWNITDRFYDKAAVVKSLATTALGGINNAFLVEHYSNPSGFNFSNTPVVFGVRYPTSRALFINELGYKNEAAPDEPFTWVRLDGYYNTTHFENLQYTNLQTTNWGGQLLVDRQLWQTEPGERNMAANSGTR